MARFNLKGARLNRGTGFRPLQAIVAVGGAVELQTLLHVVKDLRIWMSVTILRPSLSTMGMSRILLLSEGGSLQECCAGGGVELAAAHSALGDAQAAASLLAACLSIAHASSFHSFDKLGGHGEPPAQHSDGQTDASPTAAQPRAWTPSARARG